MTIVPIILSGGSGTRLWPLSRQALPKQLLPLTSGYSMLQETLLRLGGVKSIGAPIVVCGNDHRFLVAEQLLEIGSKPRAIILEPAGRNTAPAIAVAASCLQQDAADDLMMLVLPADHVIQDHAAFAAAIDIAAEAAQQGRLVTFGIKPTIPETGYGYIKGGAALASCPGSFELSRFVEKPNLETAREYLASGDYYWNSGMFLFSPKQYMEELTQFAPEIASKASEALEQSYTDLDFVRLHEASFKECPSQSVDYAVMEHTRNAAVVPVDIGWSDVGSWTALADVLDKDDAGNVTVGDVYLNGVKNSMVRSEGRMVAALGVENLIIVETSDAVLVAHKDAAQDVKKIVDYLKEQGRKEHEYHSRVYRPWGWYEGIDAAERFQVKRIMVKPGEKLSLQMHHHRAEHWVVVSGTAIVTKNGEAEMLCENQSTYIPIGTTHRLENPGKLPLHLIEVQSGGYLGEDDIVRFEDTYGRK
ncbi:mannose-1-phosphate guanylyltransferase/mannose-6-phosphate isomerase [Methylovorus sp. MP688]|uniref:mannose-1-phosphate guanylyltransferase/mannose-6-phosphate isomerase n=1 Tax=Methylovorus sp. (strain MP688) TaxID=887061 RepID=UPI00059D6547|nr:mannose-1-phosphate guanylyltransferase/mannose-6-phosphate isomerase [Methylovorus sp. MP688]